VFESEFESEFEFEFEEGRAASGSRSLWFG
jgi:hypothetical protein